MSKLYVSKFHFVGIGGIGMCGLAELLHNMGAEVTGSDLTRGAQVERLERLGIKVYLGHKEDNIDQPDVVVYSSAVDSTNPELRAARKKAIPIIRRAEALAEIMRLKRGIAIGGTHGKTTTTSLVANVLLHAGVHPTIAVGGRLDKIQSTAQLGEGEWMVAEADESDGSFSLLSPELCVVTNIDTDHLDYYGSFENLKKAFFEFGLRVPFYGAVIACGEDPVVRSVFAEFPKRVVWYGFGEQMDYSLHPAEQGYTVHHFGEPIGDLQIDMPGKHNALNALAAYVVGLEVGLSNEALTAGLKSFSGVDRRFQRIGATGGVEYYDDYAHHPTEIRATLEGFREKFKERPLKVLFQPHRFSRTEMCWEEFLDSFGLADEVWVMDIYAAGENPRQGVTSLALAEQMKGTQAIYLSPEECTEEKIAGRLQSGDVFVTLGAGNVYQWGRRLLNRSTS